MKIIYEPGDFVEVEDNIKAGPHVAASIVRLVSKNINNVWTATMVSMGGISFDTLVKVHEKWLNPK